ncbi:MAG: nucleotidyltransferase domain-containing protein [Planctomycetota bacterium]
MQLDQALIAKHLDRHPYPLLFVTMSGAHLYGFPSIDYDYDLRGCHVTPADDMLRLAPPRETYDTLDRDKPIEMDLVTHDARKFFLMLLKKNGYVLEQICSPIVIHETPGYRELLELAPKCLTRHHHYHFDSFAKSQWESVAGPDNGTVKGLLYTYRPLMAGIHLMRERKVQSNIVELNKGFGFSFIDELVERKVTGAERQEIGSADMEFHREQFEKLRAELNEASEASGLPDTPSRELKQALDDLLIRLRNGTA